MGEIQIGNIVLECNRLAVESLAKGNLKGCLHLIRRAQDLINSPDIFENKDRLLAITLSNLGCYYKASNKANLAMQAFQKALDLKSDKVLDRNKAAEIHVNVCEIREKYKQYENLVSHAKTALELLKSSENCSKELLAKSYYYLGSGMQGLDQNSHALNVFKIGLEIAYKELGHVHAVTCMLLKSYLELSTSHKQEKFKEEPDEFKFVNRKDKGFIEEIPKSTKKYVFDHNYSRNPENFQMAHNASIAPNKKTPVKLDRLSFDQLFLFDDESLSKSSVKSKNSQKNNSNLKFSGSFHGKIQSFSEIDSNLQGRSTPDNYKRCQSSQQKSSKGPNGPNGPNLPKIRSASGKHRPPSSSASKPLYKSSSKNLSFTEDHPSYNRSSSKPSSILTESLIYNKNSKSSEKAFSPAPPPQACQRPPSSARSVHFRKPSFESMVTASETFSVANPKDSNLQQILMIQKHWKGFLARKKFKVMRRRAANVKAKKALEELEELKKIVRDETMGGNEGRKHSRNRSRILEIIPEVVAEYSGEPIVIIQKYIRMHLAVKKFKKIKEAVVKIQRFLKMKSVRNLYQNILSAIVYIQRFWRLKKASI